MTINDFDGEYRFLSNFYPDNHDTLEHKYQAAKTDDPEEKAKILGAPTPGLSKKAGRKATMRADWDDIKVSVMRELLAEKFSDPELRQKLLDTGDNELVEGNYWHDTFWGVCTGTKKCRYGPHEPTGDNWLGRLLMELRTNMKEEVMTNEEFREEARMRANPQYKAHPHLAELEEAVSDSALAFLWQGGDPAEVPVAEAEVPAETPEEPVEASQEPKVIMVAGERIASSQIVLDALESTFTRFLAKFPKGSGLFGGAKGPDYLAAKGAHNIGMPYALEIPHELYHSTYHKDISDANWAKMLEFATEVNYTVPATKKWAIAHNFRRNEVMVHKADIHVVVSFKEPNELVRTEDKGGTRACVKSMMRQRKLVVLWINAETGESQWVRLDPTLG